MAVDEDQEFEVMLKEVFHQSAQEIDIDSRRAGEGSGEIEVVIGIAQPEKRCEQHPITEPRADAFDDFAKEQAVGEGREMMAVLLESGDRKHYWRVFVQGVYG